MDFDLTDEQEATAELASQVLGDKATPEAPARPLEQRRRPAVRPRTVGGDGRRRPARHRRPRGARRRRPRTGRAVPRAGAGRPRRRPVPALAALGSAVPRGQVRRRRAAGGAAAPPGGGRASCRRRRWPSRSATRRRRRPRPGRTATAGCSTGRRPSCRPGRSPTSCSCRRATPRRRRRLRRPDRRRGRRPATRQDTTTGTPEALVDRSRASGSGPATCSATVDAGGTVLRCSIEHATRRPPAR